MNSRKKALLLVGSPRAGKSTSESLGTYLLDRLRDKEMETDVLRVCPSISSESGIKELYSATDAADILILAFPLYVDSLPAATTRALELIAEHRRKPLLIPPTVIRMIQDLVGYLESSNVAAALPLVEKMTSVAASALPGPIGMALKLILGQVVKRQMVSPATLKTLREYLNGLQPKRQQFVAICNCGFPESSQAELAIEMCHRFAEETGLEWSGGLALGEGGAIDGKPLTRAGGMVRNVRKALDIAALDVSADLPISLEAMQLMSKPMMPIWLYVITGNLGWIYQAWKNGVRKMISARPLEER